MKVSQFTIIHGHKNGGRQAGTSAGRLIIRYQTGDRQAGRSVAFYVYR